MNYAVVIPCHNGGNKIRRTLTSLWELGDKVPNRIIFIDDGSLDDTWSCITELIRDYPNRSSGDTQTLCGIRLDRRRGQQSALLAGLCAVSEDAAVTMDDDGAHPVELIPELLMTLKAGADLVYASPPARPGKPFRRFFSRLHQMFLSLITESSPKIRVGSYRAMSVSLIRRVLNRPYSFPYLSVQCLNLRPRPQVGMLQSPPWKDGGGGRFSLSRLFALELRILWEYAVKKSFVGRSRDSQPVKDVAETWIIERCGL